MMKTAKLIKKHKTYSILTDNEKMWTLADYFRTEPKGNIDWLKNFLMNKSNDCISCNIYSLEKTDNDIIIDDLSHDEQEHEDQMKIPKNEFLKLLDQWEKIYPLRPDEIIITQADEGNYSMIGKFVDGREIK